MKQASPRRSPHSAAKLLLSAFGALMLASTAAQAHVGHGATTGFTNGFAHPLFGLDHLLAMVAVGLWASQMGKRAMWLVPLAFVGVMGVGGALGMAGVQLPLVEQGIVLSILVLGVLVAAAVRLPLLASVAIVGSFALFHGHAHGAEMPETSFGLTYGLGFMAATALLHAVGIGIGVLPKQRLSLQVTRYAGAAIALSSVFFFLK